MKNNPLIGILIIVSVLSLSFGYYQKARADKNELKALENERIAKEIRTQAEEQMKLAEKHRRIAEMNAIEAMRQRQIAEEGFKKINRTK